MNEDIKKIDRMLTSPVFRVVLPVVIIIMYVIGMFLMIFQRFDQGLVLWFFSTVFGALQLYVKRTQEKKKADLLQMEAEASAASENKPAETQEEQN